MSPTSQHTDVIFVVEGTALCGAYLHEIRNQYVIPTLEHFSGPIDEKDCGSDSNYCLYGIVVFHAADVLPGSLVNTVGPLNTSYKLLHQIDRIRFTGGHGEAMSNVGEGLATALECLEDLADFRSTLTDITARKHIILICNCKPYGVPVSESEGTDEEYVGKTVEQLAAFMIEKEIHLSIMSPRKIPSLIQLFDHAGGDITQQKGYARDMRHLILLNGFNLKVNEERPTSPARSNAENTISTPSQPQGVQINPPSSTNLQQPVVSSTPPASIQVSVNVQQVPNTPVQNQQPNVSLPSGMIQLPRSPASSIATSTTPLGQGLQQQAPIGVGGMQTTSSSLQQNMSQLSQQQVMQLQQQQMFQQQQFRNPRPMTAQAGNPMATVRGAMPNPQQQMSQHVQMSQQVSGGPQHQNFVKLQQQQQQQAFQQQQQNTMQQAQLQNIAMQQQQQNAMQQNLAQQQNTGQQQSTQQQLNSMQQQPVQQQQNSLLQQQQQNQLQQNLLQQQQNVLQQQQAQMQQQAQNSMQQQMQNPLQQQNQMPLLQQAQNPMSQQSQAMGQQGVSQQAQPALQQQQGSMPPQMMQQQRWPNQMTQQQHMQIAQQQARMQMPNQIPPQPQPTSNSLQRPPQEILARLNQPPMASSPGAPTASPSPIQQQLGVGNVGQAQLQRERRIIWNGYLEWHEKQKGTPEGLKIPRQVPCQVSATVVNNEPEVKGDGWPSKLIMQLIPKQIVGNLGGTYFLDVKTVLFILQNCDALVSLTKVMDSGFAGCVHFTGTGMAQNSCTIKVLILLYSKERHAYLGFIPNDQAGFVDRIRKVIQQQKTQQAAIRQGTAGIPPTISQNFGSSPGPGGMQGGMAMQGQGQQPQQSQGGLPASVQMSTQPNMIQNQATASQLQQQLAATPQIPANGPDNIELERQQNVLKIQQLQQALEQAQQRELIYTQQLQSQGPTAQSPGPGQMGQSQMAMPGQMGNQGQVQMGNQGQMPGQSQMGNQGQMPGQSQMGNQGQMPGQSQMGNQGQMPGQSQMGNQGQMPGQSQMGNQGQMPGQSQMGNQGQSQMGNQGQVQMGMQTSQMLQPQGMRQGMPPQRMQRPGGVGQLNPGLKHLLQQPGANVGPPGGFRMRMAQVQQNQMAQQQQQQQQTPFNEDLGILDLLK